MSDNRLYIDLAWPVDTEDLPEDYNEDHLAAECLNSFNDFMAANRDLRGARYERYLYGGLPNDEVPVEIEMSVEDEDQLIEFFVAYCEGDTFTAKSLLADQGYYYR